MSILAAPVAPYPRKTAHVPTLVAGTAAVALLLAATRWGSYIGVRGIYLTDVLIVLAALQYWLSLNGERKPMLTGYSRTNPGLPMQLLFFYVLIRLATSLDGFGSAPWIRDAVPYAYMGLAFLGASAVARSTERTRALSVKVLWGALLFHLAWTTVILIGGVDYRTLPRFPGAEVTIGTIRPDIDCAVLGITAAVLLRKALRKEHTLASLALLALTLVTMTATSTRGGFLAVGITISLAFILVFFAANAKSFKRPAIVALVGASILALSMVLPNSVIGQRLLATVDPSAASSVEAQRAAGTAKARDLAWDMVMDWTEENPGRRLIGAGPGPDFITESGARNVLQGTQYSNVRSPHNWLVGLYARLGLVGVALVLVTLFALLRTIWVQRSRIGNDDLLFTCAMIAAAILPIAMVGVVLESPFGAVPFWWAVGILLALGARKEFSNAV